MREAGLGRPPVRRVRSYPAVHALGAALSLALTACGGPDTRAEGSGVPFAEPPTEGTIVLYQVPSKTPGQKKARGVQPELIRITTESEKRVVRDDPTRIAGGEIEDDTRDSRPTDKSTAREILRRSLGKPFVATPERFARLCADLEEVGMFLLPRFRGGIPPEDKPYISLTVGGQTWVFLRPTDAPERDLPKDPAKRQKMLSAWAQAKLLIIVCTQFG